MRRVLTRALVWLRWPAGAMAMLLLVLTIVSSHWCINVHAKAWRRRMQWSLLCGGLCASLTEEDECYPRDTDFGLDCRDLAYYGASGSFGPWWSCEYVNLRQVSGRIESISFPAWCLFLPLGAFSWAGFHIKRRMAVLPGLCTRCRHPLAGAAVCPECGCAASSSGVDLPHA